MVDKVGSSLSLPDIIFGAKRQIIQNKAQIAIALQQRDTILAAKLRRVNSEIRKKIFDKYDILIDY